VLHRDWGPWVLNYHLLSRLLWDRHSDVEALTSDFLKNYYPSAHEEMGGFYEALERATENIAAWKARLTTATGLSFDLREQLRADPDNLFPLEHLGYGPDEGLGTSISEMADATLVARRWLDHALRREVPPVEERRIQEVDRRFAYGEATAHFYYHLVRATLFDRDQKTDLARLEVEALTFWAERLENMEDVVQASSGDANSPNGLIATGARPHFQFLREKYLR
jgi:hypothetical protein